MITLQNNFNTPTRQIDEAQFFALVKATKWQEIIDKFRETNDASWKRKLPAFIFQATFDETTSKTGQLGRWRKQSATRLTGLVVMDIDHVDNPREIHGEWLKVHGELKDLGILLVYITPSGKGLKIVFKARQEWGNLIDNQHQMAKLLGVEVDEACKDASRMSFICKESDILYLDKELFTYENPAYGQKYDDDYRNGRSAGTSASNGSSTSLPSPVVEGLEMKSESEVKLFKGIPYSTIIEEYWKRTGGKPQEGERNVRLHQLAVNLRAICDNSPQLLLQVMPRYGLGEQEMRQIIDSACREQPRGLTKVVREILDAEDCPSGATGSAKGASTPEAEDMDQQLWKMGAEIEALSVDFPILRDICKGLKPNQYPAALFVGGGLLMTLMTRCTYRFYHRPSELRRLNNSTLIIGDPASGKSFATRLYKLLAAPIVKADKKGKEAINAYRDQMRTKGANKEKPQKPKVIIRVHPARTSNAQFIQDMVNSVEEVDGKPMQLHMLTFDTELDNTVSVQRGGTWIDKQSMELKAFHNEEDGQAYSNVDSVMQDFNVTWNYIYTGTPIALKKKVNEQNFGSGLATRLTCVPLPATNFQMMEWEEDADLDSDERLSWFAELLDKTKGEMNVKRLVRKLFEWTGRRMEDAKENGSKADEMLLKRCAYHGLNFALPFIVLRHWDQMHQDGNYWCGEFETDDVDWQLTELITNMQYAFQRHFFGALAEHYFDNKEKEVSVNVQRRQKTFDAFDRLPQEFTHEDVMRCFNLSSEASARSRTSRLLSDHLIECIQEPRGTVKALFRKTGALML